MTEKTPSNENYEDMAIKLGQFVNQYKPGGWREPLRSVMPSFFFVAEDAEAMSVSFKEGNLRKLIEGKYKHEVVIDAICAFFEKNSSDLYT